MSARTVEALNRIDDLLRPKIAHPDGTTTLGLVEILLTAWEELHREHEPPVELTVEAARERIRQTFLEVEAAGYTIGGHWSGNLLITPDGSACSAAEIGIGDDYDGWREGP